MEWVLKRIFLLIAEKEVAERTFTGGCVSSTELVFACCSLRNLGGVKLGKDKGMGPCGSLCPGMLRGFKCVCFFHVVYICIVVCL